jgi:acyl-CoA dehydrogenase
MDFLGKGTLCDIVNLLYLNLLFCKGQSQQWTEVIMDFSFTEEQELFRKSARVFCEEKLAVRADEIDEEIPRILERWGLRPLGNTFTEFGGGISFVRAAIVRRNSEAEMSMAAAVYYLVGAGWGFLINRYGNRKLQEEVLPDVVKGKTFLGIASTESTGGSDITSLSTRLEKRGEGLIVNGAKAYISGVRKPPGTGEVL